MRFPVWMLIFFAGLANSLELGPVALHSRLDEPLRATIAVDAGSAPALDSVQFALSPPDAFAREGVPRSAFLEKLHFRLEPAPGGNHVLQVTTAERVTEPFLDFLVQVTWGDNSVTRHVTLLLDPPGYRPLGSDGSGRSVASEAAQASATMPRGDSAGRYGPVRRNETLYDISRALPLSRDYSSYQVMAALYRANPDAFVRNDINLLKQGAVLTIPSADNVGRISRKDAVSLGLNPRPSGSARLPPPAMQQVMIAPAVKIASGVAPVAPVDEGLPDGPPAEGVSEEVAAQVDEAPGLLRLMPAEETGAPVGAAMPAGELTQELDRVLGATDADVAGMLAGLADLIDSQRRATADLVARLEERDRAITDLTRRLEELESRAAATGEPAALVDDDSPAGQLMTVTVEPFGIMPRTGKAPGQSPVFLLMLVLGVNLLLLVAVVGIGVWAAITWRRNRPVRTGNFEIASITRKAA